MKKIITYGTFDLLHYGHIRLLKRAKALGDYLIVALSTDEFNKLKDKKSYYSYEDRKKILEAIIYVDEVIPEENWEQKISDIKKHKIDIFTMGNDWEGKFDFLKEHCEVVYLERTEGISTTKIKKDLTNRKQNLLKKSKRKIKHSAINLSKKNIFFRKVFHWLLNFKRRISYLKHYFTTTTNNKIIIFESYMGRSYSCSPKALYLTMLNDSKFKDYTFFWSFKTPITYIGEQSLTNSKIVKYASKEYYKTYAKAKYIVSNSRIPDHIILKKDQVYIQTWHGTPFKRIGHDIISETQNALNTKNDMIHKYNLDAKRYSYMISPSKFTTNAYKTAFNLAKNNPNCVIVEKGYPRNDFLYNYNSKDIIDIKKKYNIPSNKKILLYAPTWRDNQHETGLGYVYNLEVDFTYLQKELKEEYVILFRAHYFIANTFDFDKYKDFIINVSDIDDINELYIISDALVTDYSSVFFDYANLKRPILFFMYDLEFYKEQLRGFYFSLNELPGSVIVKEKDLVKNLKNLEEYSRKYSSEISRFNKKFNYLEKGKSSTAVIKEIFKR